MHEKIYLRPTSLAAAVDYYTQYPDATLWAGGTDLVVKLEHKKIKVAKILDLTSIAELRFIGDCDHQVKIGALTTIYDLETSPVIKEEFPILSQAAHALGSWQIRTLATIGGNIVTAAPSAETANPIILTDGTIIACSKNGEREIPAGQFFTGPGQTCLMAGEIVKEIVLPKLPQGFQSIYMKESLRRSMDIALANMGCVIKLVGDKCEEVRIGLGAVAPIPMRASKTEELLTGQLMSAELIENAAQIASEECKPINDIRATADYRRELVKTMVQRALTFLWKAGAE